MAIADLDHDNPAQLEGLVEALENRAEQLRKQRSDILQEIAGYRARISSAARAPVEILRRDFRGSKIPAEEVRRVVAMVEALGKPSTKQVAKKLGLTEQQARARLLRAEQLGNVKRHGLRNSTKWAISDGDTSQAPSQAANMQALVVDGARKLDVFTLSELVEHLQAEGHDIAEPTVRRWCRHYEDTGVLYAERVGKRLLYEFQTPERKTVNRPKRRTPEQEAIGEMVRRGGGVAGTGRTQRAGGNSGIVNELLREVRQVAPEVTVRKSKHGYMFIKNGQVVSGCSRTPGASGLADSRRRLQRAGINVRS